MADGWLCAREGCGHNRSQHNYLLNRLLGRWETNCTVREGSGPEGPTRCVCPAFLEASSE